MAFLDITAEENLAARYKMKSDANLQSHSITFRQQVLTKHFTCIRLENPKSGL